MSAYQVGEVLALVGLDCLRFLGSHALMKSAPRVMTENTGRM
jgi:hypothetical protein